MEPPTIQTDLRIARSYLEEAEAKLHRQAAVIFELAQRVYRDPVPVPRTFDYGVFFGRAPEGTREAPPLDIGTHGEYRRWLEEAAAPIWQDLNAAAERLKRIVGQYPGAALIEAGEPRYPAKALLAYGWLLFGDYYYYRCAWGDAAKMYRNAFALAPSSQDVLFRLGLAYVNDGDMNRAHNFLERAVELAPSSDVAVEAYKQLERLSSLRGGKKIFRGSPGVLKTLIGVSIGGLVVGLSCVCCGLGGAALEMQGDGDTQFALWWTIILVALGGLAFVVAAVVTAVYYFGKKR